MKHLINNSETYLSHMLFAGKIGLTLIFRGLVFLLHAILPIGTIPERWNLSNTSIKIAEWNSYSIGRLKK
jgi:hypothetical protein